MNNVIKPALPPGAKVLFNRLLHNPTPAQLSDDLFAVRLPREIYIDVGWFPEHDPNGAYEVCVYRGSFENQLRRPVEHRSVYAVVRTIEHLAALYGETFQSYGDSLKTFGYATNTADDRYLAVG